MSNENKARLAHELLDEINARQDLTPRQVRVLRSFLPELPKQKTLEALRHDVHDVWAGVHGNEWPDDMYCDLETWLYELHTQLKELKDTPATVPELPAGMRIADHESYGRVVVSPGLIPDGRYQIFVLDSGTKTGAECEFVHPDTLTFIDTEPAKPAHPEFLETEADYQNAPEGTIVVVPSRVPWAKVKSGDWVCRYGTNSDFSMALDGRRQVLRWGWGE